MASSMCNSPTNQNDNTTPTPLDPETSLCNLQVAIDFYLRSAKSCGHCKNCDDDDYRDEIEAEMLLGCYYVECDLCPDGKFWLPLNLLADRLVSDPFRVQKSTSSLGTSVTLQSITDIVSGLFTRMASIVDRCGCGETVEPTPCQQIPDIGYTPVTIVNDNDCSCGGYGSCCNNASSFNGGRRVGW